MAKRAKKILRPRRKAQRTVADRSNARQVLDAVVERNEKKRKKLEKQAAEDREIVTMPGGAQMARLTDIEHKFVMEYLVHNNARRAAIACGASERDAPDMAARLMADRNVSFVIAKELAERAKRYEVTADRIVEEMSRIAFSNVGDFIRATVDGDPAIDLTLLDRGQWAAISEAVVEDYTEGRGDQARDVKRVKVKTHDKLGALTSLAKRFRLFPEASDVNGGAGSETDKLKLVDSILARITSKGDGK